MSGFKTYTVAAISILWAIAGAFQGTHDWNTAAEMIQMALLAAGLRHGIPKKPKEEPK